MSGCQMMMAAAISQQTRYCFFTSRPADIRPKRPSNIIERSLGSCDFPPASAKDLSDLAAFLQDHRKIFQILRLPSRIIERSFRSCDFPPGSLKDLSDLATSLQDH